MAVGCLGALYSCAMFLLGYLSLVRRIKAKTVWKNSVFRWLLLFLKEMLQNIRYLWKMMIGLAAFLLFHWLTYIFAADGSTTWAWAFILLVTDAAAFSDVAADAYYAKAVAWAEKNGITNGLGNGKFGSDNSCTRAQIITFLYRTYQGK